MTLGELAAIGWSRHVNTGNLVPERGARSGRPMLFEDPNKFGKAVADYFVWLERNPLQEEKAFAYQGDVDVTSINKMRAPSINGLCLFIGVSRTKWSIWKNSDERLDLKTMIEWAEMLVEEGQFTGGASGLLNATMMMRKLGLTEKTETSIGGIANAPPLGFTITPIAKGTFLGEDEGGDAAPEPVEDQEAYDKMDKPLIE